MTRLILLLALAGTAAEASRQPVVATPKGPPVKCVQIVNIRDTKVRDDNTIDFVMRDGSVYRNTLPQSCPELGFEEAFSYETSQTELCNVDIITVFRNSSPIRRGASCGLGAFQPVTLSGK